MQVVLGLTEMAQEVVAALLVRTALQESPAMAVYMAADRVVSMKTPKDRVSAETEQ